MKKGDLIAGLVIGALVGLLVQPVLSNTSLESHLTFALRAGIFVAFLILGPLALWICSLIGKVWKGFYQFGQFAAVGTLNSFIDIGIFNLETFLYGTSMIGAALFAVFKAISFLFGTTNSFVWNKYWTFSAKEKANAGQVGAFYLVAVLGWVVNVAVASVVHSAAPAGLSVSAINLWTDILSPLAGIAASFLWDFFGYKYLVFKKADSAH